MMIIHNKFVENALVLACPTLITNNQSLVTYELH